MFVIAAIGFFMGAIIGSFLNVVVWRVPRGMSLKYPPSTCPKCGHRIRPWENIPILSWIFLGGRCSKCHLSISWKYPAGEAAVGVLYALIAMRVWREGLPLSTMLGWWWFAGAILSLARIDFEHGIIPNVVTYSGMIAAALLSLAFPYSRPALSAPRDPNYGGLLTRPLVEAIRDLPLPGELPCRLAALADCLCGMLLGALVLGAAYYFGGKVLAAWRKHRQQTELPEEALGKGDIKMLAMTGAFLGADSVIFLLAGGTLLGFAGALLLLAKASRRKDGAFSQVPFAPFFAVPALLWVVLGNWFYLLFQVFSG